MFGADPERWPDAYRTAVVEGLFINGDNQVDAYPAASVDCSAELLQHHSDAAGVLAELRRLLEAASLASFTSSDSIELRQHLTRGASPDV